MHPFFRYAMGNSSKNRKDSSVSKSPTEAHSGDEDEEHQRTLSLSQDRQLSLDSACTPLPQQIKLPPKPSPVIPVIKVDDQVVYMGERKKERGSENKRRLGPNRNNIIFDTLQNDLKNISKK